ncbi:MAG TPA: gfo/Idh/MocA family oxidoreductase, partial [Gemmataceae bacterium]|nr:gfo/Idh/MocA family oxidoreductase [Gemmataceae bacterium]
GILENGTVQYLTTLYLYGRDGPCITCSSGAVAQKGRMFVHGYELYLERATLVYESGATPLTVLAADGKSKQPMLKGGTETISAFTAEMQTAVNGVLSNQEPDLLSGRLARDALAMCFKECQSVVKGKPVAIF